MLVIVILMKKKILFIGAHFDDVELGCGGTIKYFTKSNHNVKILILSNSEIKNLSDKVIVRDRNKAKQEFLNSIKILAVKKFKLLNFKTNQIEFNDELISKIRFEIDDFKPDLIFTHWDKDAHQDHRSIGQATLSAGRHTSSILMYQSNNYISEEEFNGNLFIDISKYFNHKIKSIKCYKTELKRVKNKWISKIKNKNLENGNKINDKYAENFKVIKLLY